MVMLTTTLLIIFATFVALIAFFGWWGIPTYFLIGFLCGLVFYPHMGDDKFGAGGLIISAVIWPVALPFFIYWYFYDRHRK